MRKIDVLRRVTAAILAVAVPAVSMAKMSDSVPKGWIEDFALAKKTAAVEGKFIFLAFSGSDWCGWCVKLEREVYSQKEFVNKAGKKFVLTMIDSPRNREILSKLALEQNRPLAQAFGIRGYPTGIVCDGEGVEIGRIGGYVQGGPQAYLERMLALVKDREVPKPAASAGASIARDAFSWGVPMGGAIMKASNGPDSQKIKDLTERKIKANRDSIEKVGITLTAMSDAKTESAARRSLAAFETAVKSYYRTYVGGYGEWPLVEWEMAGEQSVTAKAAIKALEAVSAGVADAKVRAVYDKKLETMRRKTVEFETRYRKLCPDK